MKTTAAMAAKMIRNILKTAYPEVKFSVTSSNYSGGNSVSIEWEGHKHIREIVEQIVGKFAYGHFDCSDDSYKYSNNNENIPQVRFVHVRNHK